MRVSEPVISSQIPYHGGYYRECDQELPKTELLLAARALKREFLLKLYIGCILPLLFRTLSDEGRTEP